MFSIITIHSSNYDNLRETPSLNRRRPHIKFRHAESENDDSDDDAALILRQRAASRVPAAGQAAGVPVEMPGEVSDKDRKSVV